MFRLLRSSSSSYLVAVAAVVVAVLLRWLLDPFLGQSLPLVTLFGAVVFAVWLAGLRPALVASVLGYVLCAYLFIEPRGSVNLGTSRDLVGFAAYGFTCALVIWVGNIARSGWLGPSRWTRAGPSVMVDEGGTEWERQTAEDATFRRRELDESRASELRSRTILESITDGFFTLDRNWRFDYVNPEAERILGCEPGELLGQVLWEKYPGTVGTDFERAYRRVATSGTAESFLSYYPDHDVWYDVRAYPASHGLSVYFRNVTEAKRAEAALRASEERRRLALDSAELGAWNVDPATSMLTTDERYRKIFTGTTAPLDYEQAFATIHPNDRQRVREGVAAALRPDDPAPFAEEYRVVHPDGTVRWVFGKGRSNFEGEGSNQRLASFDGTVADITERKLSEERLRQGEQQMRMALAAARMLAWEHDASTGKVVLSDNVGEMFGLLPGSRLERSSQGFALIHPDDVERHRSMVAKAIEERGSYLSQYRLIRPVDGEMIWLEERGQAVDQPGNDGVRLIGFIVDITERKRADEQLREADRRKDEFLATLAHELRNPLAPIRNSLEVIRRAGNHGEVVERARLMMERQLGQMVRLVDDLLDVSRISSDKLELRKERVTLAMVVGSAVETSRPLVDAKGVQLAITLPPEAIYLDADLTRLAQVFMNLINNAVKFTEPGGRVSLNARQHGGEVVIAVKDTGVEIPADQLIRIFEMFSQVNPAFDKSQGGLGIGLTLAKRLVELHDGRVEARSDGQGRGSERRAVAGRALGDCRDTGTRGSQRAMRRQLSNPGGGRQRGRCHECGDASRDDGPRDGDGPRRPCRLRSRGVLPA